MHKPNVGLDKPALEREWIEWLAQAFQGAQRRLWNRLGYVHRLAARDNSTYIIWEVVDGSPLVRDYATVVDMVASFKQGLCVKLCLSSDPQVINTKHFEVSHAPVQLNNYPLFMWIPFFNEMRFASYFWSNPQAARELQFSLCVKQQSDSETVLVNGEFHVTLLSKFQKQWPNIENYQRT